jgi:hypothetical protein
MKVKNLWKYSGILLYSIGILHTILAVVIMATEGVFMEIIRKGVFNSIQGDYKIGMSFWFFVLGIVIIFFGFVLHHYIKLTNQPAPRFFGWFLLIFGIVGAFFVPASGFFLFILFGLLVLLTKKSA